MIQSTVDMLRAMKMTAMAAELERQSGDAAYRELSVEERLSLIVNAEWNRRQNNRINRLSNAAHFAQPGATMEGIEYELSWKPENILREKRSELGLTQKQVAKKSEIPYQSYQKFESGERSIMTCSFQIACRVIEALQMDITKFFHGEY